MIISHQTAKTFRKIQGQHLGISVLDNGRYVQVTWTQVSYSIFPLITKLTHARNPCHSRITSFITRERADEKRRLELLVSP